MNSREKLVFYRKRAKLTQAQLGAKSGTTRSMIVKLELGERNITEKWRGRFAVVFGIEPDDLLPSENGLDGLPSEEKDLIRRYRLMSPAQRDAFRSFVKASQEG